MILRQETKEKYGYDSEQIAKFSTKMCIFKCDYCFSTFERTMREKTRGSKKVPQDACSEKACRNLKSKEVFHSHTNKNIDKINESRKQTCLKRFGVPNAAQSSEKKKKYSHTVMKRYGVSHFSKTKQFSQRAKLPLSEIQERAKLKGYVPLFTYEEYCGHRHLLPFRCNKHDRVFSTSIFNLSFDHFQCPLCNAASSHAEKELLEFIQESETCLENNRKIIPPYELDIVVPGKNVAIEFHGLYWHSEINKDKDLHFKKFCLAAQKDIQLIQIYEDEWRDNKDICKSLIRSKLGTLDVKFPARKLKVVQNNKQAVGKFFEFSHLAGNTKFNTCFSLEDESHNVICALSLRKPFTKTSNVLEIARFATKPYSQVMGGFSKLMSRVVLWAKKNNVEKILTYSDCRYSVGKLYEKYGFRFVKHTGCGYDYTDFVERYGRFKFRAKDGKTERTIAAESKVFRIYNAGNYRWELDL